MNYPYVLVVVNDKTGPIYYVTLETTVFGTKAIGVFDTTGIHQNFGFDDLLNGEQAFIDKAIALVQDKFGERFQESAHED